MKLWLRNKIVSLYPGVDFDVLDQPEETKGYATNLAFVLAKQNKTKPVDEAGKIAEQIEENEMFEIEAVAPGFVNFNFKTEFVRNNLKEILKPGGSYGTSDSGNGKKINIEFVSANPTGPLTVANARAAAFGDTLGNILNRAGYKASKEYYINDVGVQVNLLGLSVAKRYLESKGETVEFETNLYQGDYVKNIAQEISGEIEKAGLGKDLEKLSDFCRERAIEILKSYARKSMKEAGVDFDVWFSEKTLHESGEVKKAFEDLKSKGKIVEKDGASWLKVDESDPEKNAVVIKSDGSTSYLMNDIAYTRNKFGRGFDRAINIWGADHHGDVARLKSGVAVLGYEPDRLEILLHQLVSIKQEDELKRMSKREGRFVLLDDLIKEVGKDALRFFFLSVGLNAHMVFDVDLAKEQSKNNPVYYIQYAYARLNQIFAKSGDAGYKDGGDADLLKEEDELRLMRRMVKLPDLVEDISGNYQVHRLAQYAFELASDFHNFYEKHHVIGDDKKLQEARLVLCSAVQTVLKSSLELMGLSTPDRM